MTIIRVIDFETTGFPEKGGKIIEVGWSDVHLERETEDTMTARLGNTGSKLFGMPEGCIMDPGAQAVHHIQNCEIAEERPFDTVDGMTLESIDGVQADFLSAHNAKFEMDMLKQHGVMPLRDLPPFLCTMKLAKQVYPTQRSYALGQLRYSLNLQLDHTKAALSHRAQPDTYVTAVLLIQMLPQCSWDMEIVRNIGAGPAMHLSMPFGKHKGVPFAQVPIDYFTWLVNSTVRMDQDLRDAVEAHLATRPEFHA
jgi:exodeoxyribonuclease X